MFKTLLATTTILIAASSFVQASMPTLENSTFVSAKSLGSDTKLLNMFADKGSNSGHSGGDGNSSDDNSGSGGNGGSDDSSNDNSGPGHGNDDNGIEDNGTVPHVSGCDSAHDIAEHPECRS